MANIESSFLDLGYLETLSSRDTPIHRLDPRVKLLTTVIFIATVLSFNRYEVSGLLPFVLYPVALVALGNLPVGYLLKKIVLAAPFAFFIGVLNPLFDRAPLVQMGTLEISGGWVSFASIMIRFALAVSAALLLIATTGFNAMCMALERIGVPSSFAVQLSFLYRYLFVLIDEAARLTRARSLRSFGGKGMGLQVYSFMIGQLLLRTLDRAQRIHRAMLCRGFDGRVRILRQLTPGSRDALFLIGWTALFMLMRLYNLPHWLGSMITEAAK